MSKLSFMFAIALVSAAPAGIAAARPVEAPVTVSVRGVDFSNPAQVKAFYDHVKAVARAACSGDTLTPWGVREDQECRARFVADAVNQVNAPLLTAMNAPESSKTTAYAFGDQ